MNEKCMKFLEKHIPSVNLKGHCRMETADRRTDRVSQLPDLYPLVPGSLQDVYNLLQETKKELCQKWEVYPPADPEAGEEIEDKWRSGTSVCVSLLPPTPTPSTCRIYSIRYDQQDVNFEHKIANRGCRVHLWGNKTEYKYTRTSKNAYLYPVDIDTSSGPEVYSLDDFLELLGHEKQRIHYVKSTLQGGYKDLLRALFASKSKAWQRITQIRLVVHLPKVTSETWKDLEEPYRNLMGLNSLGFKLARSRQDPRYLYTLPATKSLYKLPERAKFYPSLTMDDYELPFSKIYEMVWVRID